MNKLIFIWLYGLLVAISATSCKSPNRPAHIEDYCSDYGIAILHHEIFPIATIRDEKQKEYLMRNLSKYLEGQPGAASLVRNAQSRYSDNVRVRDFCAVFLSELSGVPLHLFTYETDFDRDRKINEFIQRLPTYLKN